MDSDPEVVREPFEDEARSNYSFEQSPNRSLEEGHSAARDLTGHHVDGEMVEYNSNDTHSQNNTFPQDIEHSLSEDSSCHAEDSEFAKSFGIHLETKQTNRKLTIDSLIEAAESSSSRQETPILKTSVTSDCIYHKGTFYQKGDIVSICDLSDGLIYFAQLTGFLQDQYCEKSASVNWLVPTRPTSRELFDPSAYAIGLEDTLLRKLDCMNFVCHCPHDYYVRKFFNINNQLPAAGESRNGQSVPISTSKEDRNYIWTSLSSCLVAQARKS